MMRNILLIAIIGIVSCKDQSKEKKLDPGQEKHPAATVKLTDLEGQPIQLEQYRGKTVFVNFWATWCKPCVQEMPSIKTAQAKLSKTDVVFLLASNESSEEIREFEENHNYKFSYTKVANLEELGVAGLPTTFIFNPKGELAFSETGYRKWDDSTNLQLILEINNQK